MHAILLQSLMHATNAGINGGATIFKRAVAPFAIKIVKKGYARILSNAICACLSVSLSLIRVLQLQLQL